jgi:hypothetical protein
MAATLGVQLATEVKTQDAQGECVTQSEEIQHVIGAFGETQPPPECVPFAELYGGSLMPQDNMPPPTDPDLLRTTVDEIWGSDVVALSQALARDGAELYMDSLAVELPAAKALPAAENEYRRIRPGAFITLQATRPRHLTNVMSISALRQSARDRETPRAGLTPLRMIILGVWSRGQIKNAEGNPPMKPKNSNADAHSKYTVNLRRHHEAKQRMTKMRVLLAKAGLNEREISRIIVAFHQDESPWDMIVQPTGLTRTGQIYINGNTTVRDSASQVVELVVVTVPKH